jgi:hypothetical protein
MSVKILFDLTCKFLDLLHPITKVPLYKEEGGRSSDLNRLL